MIFTASQIEQIATRNNMTVSTVIPSNFEEVEYLAVRLKFAVTAFFIMDNETFDYKYSHTYNAATDKTTKRIPSKFSK